MAFRMMDEQRMHLKNLEDAKRDGYNANIRAMATAANATNMQQLGEKQSREKYWQQYEATKDQTDLAKINSTALNPTSTLSMGTSANFRM